MANEKVESKEGPAKPAEVKHKLAAAPAKPEEKLKFLVWYTKALDRFEGLKAHHMTAVRAYFKGLGVNDPATSSDYDHALKKYGLKKKKK
jgi:hypothetical protein